jgi:hypothetical protein
MVEVLCYKVDGHGFRSNEILEFFQFTESFQPHDGPRVYSSSDRNEYQKIFLGVKHGQHVRLTT